MSKLHGFWLAGMAWLALGAAPLAAQEFEQEQEFEQAQDFEQRYEAEESQRDNWSFSLGFGGDYSPDYDGSDDYQGSPLPIIGITYRERFYFSTEEGGLGALLFEGEWLSANAFVGYDFGRDSGEGSAGGGTTGGTDDNDALRGFKKVDGTAMAGISVDAFIGFAEASLGFSQGFGGHKGALLDFGLSWPIPLSQDETLGMMIGVSGAWASDDYMKAYFGVTQDEACAHNRDPKISNVPMGTMREGCVDLALLTSVGADNLIYEAAQMNPNGYQAKAGIMSYGASMELFWQFRPKWQAGFFLDYTRLVGDAADSPLVKIAGTESQISGGVSISYLFSW